MSAITRFMKTGPLAPKVHGVLDYPLAAVLIAGPLVLAFDDQAATTIALVFGAGAALLAVATAWSTGIVRAIPPLAHGYADLTVTLALIATPFIAGFAADTVALAFYTVVGAGGLLATLATRFESDLPTRGTTALQAAA